MNILIADDNAANRTLLKAMLEPLGHTVISTSNGQQALEALGRQKIDLIISDILMPVMDGFHLCMDCKKDENFRKIPFIFYTATYTDREDEEFSLSLGADRFILKPLEPELFLKAIGEVMQEASEGRFHPRQPSLKEKASLTNYSQRLAKKLDKKIDDLQKEVASRIKAEEKLRELNRYLEGIIENANVWFNVLDEKARVVMWNKAAEQISGYSAEEVTGNDKIWKLMYPDKKYRDEIYGKADSIINRNEIVEDFETTIRCKDGEFRIISWFSRNLKDEQGKPIGSVALGRDVTRRNQAEKELRESLQQYRQLFDANADALFVLNENGRFLDVNVSAERIYQYSREELLKMNARDLSSAELKDKVAGQIKKAMTEGIPFEWTHQRRDGKEFPVEIAPSILDLKEGRKAVLSAVRNLTERRQAEEERKLLQKQLNHAQKMESVGRLAGGVAHDFNNILSVIIGYSELAMVKLKPDDPLREDLKQIHAAAGRSKDITRQLLAFARRETISPEILDLNSRVEGMLKILRRLIGEDVELAWIPGNNLWPVLMDPTQIDQILANLCVNARDAISNVGKITIETDKAAFDASYCADHTGFVPGEFLMLSVSDDGCGMDRETLDKIFEPFFTTKQMGHGTGLGLATVYGIIRQNDGFVNVYSEPGEGTIFRIYLPSHKGSVLEDQEGKGEDKIPMGRGETILVVEDEDAILKLTEKILVSLKYKVLTAGTPSRALQLASSCPEKISLLITDVVMPEMNGKELSEQIHKVCPRMKGLFMSGYTADTIAHRGILDEGIKFIRKPFSTMELASKVREILDEKD